MKPLKKVPFYHIQFRPIEKCSMSCPFCYIGQLSEKNPTPMGVFQNLPGKQSFERLDQQVLSTITSSELVGANLSFGFHGGDPLQVPTEWLRDFAIEFRKKYPKTFMYCVSNLVAAEFEEKLKICKQTNIEVMSSLNSEMLNQPLWKRHIKDVQDQLGRIGLNTLFFPEKIQPSKSILEETLDKLPRDVHLDRINLSIEYYVDDKSKTEYGLSDFYSRCEKQLIELFEILAKKPQTYTKIFQNVLDPFLEWFLWERFPKQLENPPVNPMCSGLCSTTQIIIDQQLRVSRCSKHFEAEQLDGTLVQSYQEINQYHTELLKDSQCELCKFSEICIGVCQHLAVRDQSGTCQNLLGVVDWLCKNEDFSFRNIEYYTVQRVAGKKAPVLWEEISTYT